MWIKIDHSPKRVNENRNQIIWLFNPICAVTLTTITKHWFVLHISNLTIGVHYQIPTRLSYIIWFVYNLLERSCDALYMRNAAMHIVAFPTAVSIAWRATKTCTQNTISMSFWLLFNKQTPPNVNFPPTLSTLRGRGFGFSVTFPRWAEPQMGWTWGGDARTLAPTKGVDWEFPYWWEKGMNASEDVGPWKRMDCKIPYWLERRTKHFHKGVKTFP